jgi:hypothetical protein
MKSVTLLLSIVCMSIQCWPTCNCNAYPDGCSNSPIVIDTLGTGLAFSDPNTVCVRFDLKNDGKPGCYSFPLPGSGGAFLVYDADNDGKIDSGAEMFGTYSLQPVPMPPGFGPGNGFTALTLFDTNSDTVINNQDARWSRLKLWKPDHCFSSPDTPCSALPSELSTLESNGIHSLSLVYRPNDQTDQWGNHFRFWGELNPLSKNPDNRAMVDVYLAEGSGK